MEWVLLMVIFDLTPSLFKQQQQQRRQHKNNRLCAWQILNSNYGRAKKLKINYEPYFCAVVFL